MSTLKTNTLSNVAGTASTAIENAINGSAKAWVNFNGTGTVAISKSYNVSSITDNATGQYTVNFTNAMPDSTYCMITNATSYGGTGPLITGRYPNALDLKTTTQVAFLCMVYNGNSSDSPEVYVSIFS